MFKRKKYIFNKLKEVGINDSIIHDLYEEKITEEEVNTIVTSNYPYDICRLLISKEFREQTINKNQIISFINDSEHNYQAYYASMAAINKDVLENNRTLSIVYNITRAKNTESAKLAYEIAIDKTILDTEYSNIATAMASNGTSKDKIYALVKDSNQTLTNHKTKSLTK